VATPNACYVIDPFADIDLEGLYELFEDARILKIMHSPGEDLRLLHALQCYPKNLFDTEVTARLLNYEQTSLAAMLQEKLSHAMCKQQQRSNWLRRPLTPEQLQYAADDVAFLHALKAVLEAEASEMGLMPYVLEEQAALSTTIYQQEDKAFFLKPADLRTLSPYEQHVLNALFVHRDELARQLNRPAYQIMDEPLVRSLADGTLAPRDLPDAKGLYGGFRNSGFAAKLSARLETIRDEADDMALSHNPPPRQRFSNSERVDREAANRDKEEKFVPVQQALVERFGEHAARFILSNGTVNDLLKRMTTIGSLKRAYKQELVRSIAGELAIDLSAYE
jgi:ribonuclease D